MFNVQEEKEKFASSNNIKLRVLNTFFDFKGIWNNIENKEQLNLITRRHIRDAKLIVDGKWSKTRVENVMRDLNNDDFMRDKWTLQTVFKILTK